MNTKFHLKIQRGNLFAPWSAFRHSWLLVLLCLVPVSNAEPSYKLLHQFTNFWGQESPWGDLVQSGGILYGATEGFTGRGEVYKVNLDGSGFAKLWSLEQNGASGGLVMSGNTLYGTTVNEGSYSLGRVF